MANNWVVVVKHPGSPQRKRVFVEDVQYEDAAKRLALLKLGISSSDHEIHADPIDEKVSVENPNENLKTLYDQALDDLTAERQAREEAQFHATANLARAKRAEVVRDRLTEDNALTLANLAFIKSTLDEIQRRLEHTKRRHSGDT